MGITIQIVWGLGQPLVAAVSFYGLPTTTWGSVEAANIDTGGEVDDLFVGKNAACISDKKT